MTFSPDVDNNPSNPHVQWTEATDVHKLCVTMRNDTGEMFWAHEEKEVQKGMESHDTSWNLAVIRNQSATKCKLLSPGSVPADGYNNISHNQHVMMG